MDLKVALILTSCLISQGRCLMCHNCLPDDTGFCHDVQGPCPEECASVRVASYIDGRKQGVMNLKTCSQSDMCIVGSINFGTSRVKVENTCCSTHLCNGKTPPESREDISNGNRCYTCRNGDCSSTVECLGDEDRCVTSIATDEEGRSTGIQKGCASMSICQQRDSSSLFLADLADQLICCEGQLCNDGTVATTNHNAGNLAHLTRSNRHILLAMVAVSVYGFQ
ncbi:urokinase plasminogen activator surface receptor-like [Engraulis encrasicolus]|uniref:urokinase plasminogen activator surface receptor-like n=1 Tax=Engraulis encrasicolus TaxID=184585 RepID=UPI002FD34EAE